ncbi:DUF3040 domain-containing protein [Georgenia alba]|uniref:DUF3040 domain-containing protein n=1 Tax=Georgenia alba TaxID=2233858 RepID=A0ABW2Q7C8_9MICO
MPLSEYEQRMLQQMEQQLRSDDPKLANTLADKPRPSARRLGIGILLLVVGLAGLVGGVATEYVWLGVLGFVAMLAGVMLAITGPRKSRPAVRRPGGSNPSSGGFMQRQEERWQRRNEERGR